MFGNFNANIRTKNSGNSNRFALRFYTLCISQGFSNFSNMSNRIIYTPTIETGTIVMSFISSASDGNILKKSDAVINRIETTIYL